jgi:SAM-dependent methyltransferase
MLEPLLALETDRKGSLLDVGCGFGFVPHFWENRGMGSAVGLETSEYGVIGKEKLKINIIHKYMSKADEIAGRKFRFVFSSEVIEHVKEPKTFLHELRERLEPGGILILTTPSASGIKEGADFANLIATLSPGFHYFISSAHAMRLLLEEIGFKFVRVKDTGSRLLVWASDVVLPNIKDGFVDWEMYLDYLTDLAKHPDPHVAGGAAYRALKDSLNLGMFQRSREIYPIFSALARDTYGLDFAAVDDWSTRVWSCDRRDHRVVPSWAGCGLLFAGIYQHRFRGSLAQQQALFVAAIDQMEQDVASDLAQFSQESSYFLPLARANYLRAMRDAGKTEILEVHANCSFSDLARGEICLLSIYAPTGKVGPCTKQYIDALVDAGVRVIACLALDDTSVRMDPSALPKVSVLLSRRNAGYDFGMWADIIRTFPQVLDAKRVYFANDSVVIIPSIFPQLIETVRKSTADFVAATESSDHRYHTQSFFFAFRGKALSTPAIRSFWNSVRNLPDKRQVIKNYELTLVDAVRKTPSLSVDVIFNTRILFPEVASDTLQRWNPTHYFWDRLVDRGFPFIKMDLLRDNPQNIPTAHVYDLLRSHGVDVELVQEHIAASQKERPSRESSMSALKRKKRKYRRLAFAGFGLFLVSLIFHFV